MFNVLAAKVLDVDNEISNPNFDDVTGWANSSSILTASGNVLIATGNGTSQYATFNTTLATSYSTGDKWFIFMRTRVTNPNCVNLYADIDGSTGGTNQLIGSVISSPIENEWYSIFGIVTIQSDFTGNLLLKPVHQYPDAATTNGKVMEIEGSPTRGGGAWAIKMDGHMKNYTENQMYYLVRNFFVH